MAFSFSNIAKRDNGRFPLSLRSLSIVLTTGSLVACIFAADNNIFMIVPSIVILIWDIIYVVLLLFNFRILLPFTITFDLVAWLLAILWGIFYAIWSVPEMGRYLSAGMTPCSPNYPCDRELRILNAQFANCVLLWTITPVHFALFVHAIVILEREKMAAARGIRIRDTPNENSEEA